MRVGVLSSVASPLLVPSLAALHDAGLFDLAILLDEKTDSEKDLAIWRERTGGFFERQPDMPATLHGFREHLPPAYFVGNHNGQVCRDLIGQLSCQVLINAGTPRKLNTETLKATPHGVINVHPGMLPKYRGASCVEWAIYNGDQVGNTAHFMTEGYDEGPIIAVEGYDFPRDADYPLVRCLTYKHGFHLMAKTVKSVLAQKLMAHQLPPQEPGQYWKPIPPEKMEEVRRKVAAREYKFMTL